MFIMFLIPQVISSNDPFICNIDNLCLLSLSDSLSNGFSIFLEELALNLTDYFHRFSVFNLIVVLSNFYSFFYLACFRLKLPFFPSSIRIGKLGY